MLCGTCLQEKCSHIIAFCKHDKNGSSMFIRGGPSGKYMSLVRSLLSCAILYLYSTSVKATPLDCECSPVPESGKPSTTPLMGNSSAPFPPACYKSQPTYDPTVCSSIIAQWHASSFHLQDPRSIDYPTWAGDSCLSNFENGTSVNGDPRTREKGCSIGGYPVYVVNATGREEVVAAVKWAGERNVRVNIKATGHSFMGR
ncbi:hypothetical protein BDBG_05121 [Blastomyces gilchristii SLH14081]|uniref:FAD-binding PCMH-type domain-containing protein n=1 Tax=Blastomyces gilchristii (strain SLH14081) TaxID=559298 RepID=A0A179UQ40_BLAGS|nr:uncharacterized protein BDBG_05121 [Blastomyces gilchristii SLH14081]OAT09318.1 hypothetical protein BDBG_05121 [Blastomyces gilchristii SLH14081]